MKESVQKVDIIRGEGIDHFHFRSTVTEIENGTFLADHQNPIQIGDLIYRGSTIFVVGHIERTDQNIILRTKVLRNQR